MNWLKESVMKVLLFIVIMVLVSGCSWFTRPMEQPVIEDKLNSGWFNRDSAVGTLSLTPERRVVLYNFRNGRLCAEGPTEVGMDLSRLFKATASLDNGKETKLGLDALSKINSTNAVLNKRSQGVQLFQAYAYFMCQMYMNEAIDKDEFNKSQSMMFEKVIPLIEKEMPLLYRQQNDNVGDQNRTSRKGSSKSDKIEVSEG